MLKFLVALLTALTAPVGRHDGATETVTTISSAAGELRITRATIADYDTVMRILREAADWLTSSGNPQWEHWHLEVGESMLRQRIEEHEVYLASLDTRSIATAQASERAKEGRSKARDA